MGGKRGNPLSVNKFGLPKIQAPKIDIGGPRSENIFVKVSGDGVQIGGGSSGGGSSITIGDPIDTLEDGLQTVGDAIGDVADTGADLLQDGIDTTVKGIEDTANEIGRIDDNLIKPFQKPSLDIFKGIVGGMLGQWNPLRFDGAGTGINKSRGETALQTGGFEKNRKKNLVSSSIGLETSEGTGIQE